MGAVAVILRFLINEPFSKTVAEMTDAMTTAGVRGLLSDFDEKHSYHDSCIYQVLLS